MVDQPKEQVSHQVISVLVLFEHLQEHQGTFYQTLWASHLAIVVWEGEQEEEGQVGERSVVEQVAFSMVFHG